MFELQKGMFLPFLISIFFQARFLLQDAFQAPVNMDLFSNHQKTDLVILSYVAHLSVCSEGHGVACREKALWISIQ